MELIPAPEPPFAERDTRAYLSKPIRVVQAGRWRVDGAWPTSPAEPLADWGLSWRDGERTVKLGEALAAQRDQPWHDVTDWTVDTAGRSLCVVAGFREVLYDVALDDGTVTPIYRLDPKLDARPERLARLDDDQILLLCQRSLRLFRRTAGAWSEIAKARISNGWDLAAGQIDGEPMACVITINHRTSAHKALVFALRKDALKKIDQSLSKVWRTHYHAGAFYIGCGNAGWHRAALTPPKKKAARPKFAHPLLKATLDLVPSDPPATPSAVEEALRAGCDTSDLIRRVGPATYAMRDRAALRIWRDGAVHAFPAPTQILRFDVSPTGDHAFITTGREAHGLWERRLDTDDTWREVPVTAAAGGFVRIHDVLGVARFDADHVVVQSGAHLVLVCRGADGTWASTHRVSGPQNATLRALPPLACVAQTGLKTLTLYGLAGERLKKLTKTTLPWQRHYTAVPDVVMDDADRVLVDPMYRWLTVVPGPPAA